MTQRLQRLGVLILGVFSAAHFEQDEPQELSVADFDLEGRLGSNNSVISKVGPNHFRILLGDQPGIGHQCAFTQFTIMGHAKGNDLTLDVVRPEGANGSYREYFHSWSYDHENWHTLEWTGTSFRFPVFEEDTVYFGNQVPMSAEKLDELIVGWKESPHVEVVTVGKSTQGRELYRIVVTDAKSGHPPEKRWVHYFANQHGCEGNAQWRVAGMIDWSLSDEASDFRKRSICHFIVMMSPDSPAHGWMRGNAEGQDMNRSYLSSGADSEKQTTEPHLWQKDLQMLMASDSPVTDIWSCHTWGGMVDLLYTEGPEIGTAIGSISDFDAILDTLDTKDLINPITRKEGGDRTKWSLGPHDQFGITAFLCEGAGGIKTKAGNLESGAILLEALSLYYTGTIAD